MSAHLCCVVGVTLHELCEALYVSHDQAHASSAWLAQGALALLPDELRQAGHLAAVHMEHLPQIPQNTRMVSAIDASTCSFHYTPTHTHIMLGY